MRLSPDIIAAVRTNFAPDVREAAVRRLHAYVSAADAPAPERVARGIIALSEGRLDRLAHFIERAKQDYRDILWWAESPPEPCAASRSPMTQTNGQWRLAQRPDGLIAEGDFAWHEEPVPTPGDGELLVRSIYLSLDPTNRTWIEDQEGYLPAVQIGDLMRGGVIGVVETSRNDRYTPGDIVAGTLGWQQFAVTDGRGLTRVPRFPGVPLTAAFGLFGHIGVTAYFGLLDVGKPVEGETVVVSAAAGAVGSLVGQIAKIQGCRVVGIAGTDEKCRWITEDLGMDAAVNYKTENVRAAVARHCPDGVDVYFENVGGDIFRAAVPQLNNRGRVVLCGLISQYTGKQHAPLPAELLGLMIVRRLRMEGFIVLDYMRRHDEAAMQLGQWFLEGALQYRVDVVDGLQAAPLALNKLFEGTNRGKLLVKVADEPPAPA